jgi:hypothetical protein
VTWDIIKDIKLRQLEFRMRNADELRLMLMKRTNEFADRHAQDDDWLELRNIATEVLVEAQAVLDEAVNIAIELELLKIPEDHAKAQETNLRIAKHSKFLVEKVKPVRDTMRWVIEAEDQKLNGPDADPA